MAVAWLLAGLGLAGVAAGLWLGQSRAVSSLVAAAGGGLLFGISIFWLIPEIAAESGWIAAWALTVAASVLLALIDELFLHSRQPAGNVALGPILAATAVHSFLDGWSVRALANFRVAGITAPLGLALHKIPEGLAIGWIARQNVKTHWKAAAAAAGVELITVAGALSEPYANRSGFAAFGVWWTSGVLAIIGGSFLFLGIHALVPNRRQLSAIVVFAVTLLAVGAVSLVHARGL